MRPHPPGGRPLAGTPYLESGSSKMAGKLKNVRCRSDDSVAPDKSQGAIRDVSTITPFGRPLAPLDINTRGLSVVGGCCGVLVPPFAS